MTEASMLLRTSFLQVPHGFATRRGGVSKTPYDSLNLGMSTGDSPEHVTENRQRVITAFGLDETQVCVLQQIHSAKVVEAKPGWLEFQADAAVTDKPDLLLVINTADCLPILFHDPVKNVIGAAHAGWRGTVAGIAPAVVTALGQYYGSSAADLRVLIGPGIRGVCYQVGEEVATVFHKAGFPQPIYPEDDEGRFRLDLIKANRYLLEKAGLKPEAIYSLDQCTHCDKDLFYSHRRDGLKRGSHWSLIRL